MYEPNYTDYSLEQLHDCLQHINADKYPDRYHLLRQEIALRRERGETLTDPLARELIASDVPFNLGARAWWCYTWRIAAAAVLVAMLSAVLTKINTIAQLFSPETLFVVKALILLPLMIFASIFIMMQVLAKRYKGYRIRFIQTDPQTIADRTENRP